MKTRSFNNKGNQVNVNIPEKEQGIADDLNPKYLFSGTWTDLLVKIANGEVNAQELAKIELANRGLNLNGAWVGFAQAKKDNGII